MDAQNPQPNSNELQEQLQALTEENFQLRDKTERLFTKVDYLEGRLGHLATSNTEVSCRLLQSEEDKLKTSKELVEEKIHSNKMREQFEEEKFELKNKILNQDGVIAELGIEQDKLLSKLQSAEACLKVGERSSQNLTEEYSTLKKNYQALAEAHGKERAQSDELSAELLALAQAQDVLRRQLEEQQQSVKTTTQGLHGELERVQALITRMSHNRVKLEDLAALDNEQKTMEKYLLGNQEELKQMLEKMKTSYEEQQRKLEETVEAMGKEHQQNKRAIRNDHEQELSERSAGLMCSESQVKEVEEENSRLQLQVKQLNEEYRLRLVCYLQDLTEYIDELGVGGGPSGTSKLRSFVHSMLQDVRSSYRVREEQLASAARSYKKRLQKITKTHHAFIIAYRVQREQILAKPESTLDPGPPEAHFNLGPTEVRDETGREFQHLCHEEAGLQAQLQVASEQMAVRKTPVKNVHCQKTPASLGQICAESWSDVRKQLREITDSTLMGFEKECALLITRATVAEAQVLQLQDYIDKHLGRYKEEILHMCRLHGIPEAGRSQSANSSLR